jgi:L,D-peptidoglycan transpeptidase YkuD (ErfK/YbiS/YcfS/YnhG family)
MTESPSPGVSGERECEGRLAAGVFRRALLSVPLQMMAVRLSRAAQIDHENLEYRDGRLYWSGGNTAATVGRAGVKVDKHEGDGATPAGTYPLVSIYYRPDRVAPPLSKLPVNPLAPNAGWVDEPSDANYNRPVSLPYPASAEQLWRDDELYDALVVIGYNMDPVVPGAGSAIFLHIAAPEFAPTAGCIAVQKQVLLGLLPLLRPGSKIAITG